MKKKTIKAWFVENSELGNKRSVWFMKKDAMGYAKAGRERGYDMKIFPCTITY